MDHGRVLERRDIAEIERRPTDASQAIHQGPGELIGPEFVTRLDATLALARDQFGTIWRYAP